MTSSDGPGRLTNWREREARVFRVLPYGGLVLGTLLALLAPAPKGLGTAFTIAVAAAAGCWIAWFVTLHPGWQSRLKLMAVYYAGLLALAAVLVAASPWYGFFAWIGYIHAFPVLPKRWRIAGVTTTAALVATSQGGGLAIALSHWPLWLVLVLFNLGVAGSVSWFAMVGEQEDAKRQRLVLELGEANRQLGEANRQLTETVRENAGLHAQLLTQAREAGVLDERQRMAREIHDTLAQGLTGIITQLEAAEQTRDRSADWRRHVDNALALARESLTEARRSVRAVRPESLESARLPDALVELGERWSALHGVRAEVSVTGQAHPLHPEVEVTLLRTAQESLANVARHASASRVGLTLSYMGDLVTLDIRDDGVGFTVVEPLAARQPAGGYGLTVMRQRVTQVGGELAVESEPGSGTAVSASVPALAGSAG
ncbi:sensor histidine kinase [Micromonospora profundi]|uniref:sensor histidine kinase n=1 Tax=Micromonospora TaxID=1873 RepID=UPI00339E5DE1